MKKKMLMFFILWFILVMAGIFTGSIGAQEVPRISKAEVIKMLDNPDVLIVDVRIGKDWSSSEFKIKGALRRDPFSWSSPDYPKDKTIVFYCA